MKEKELRRSLAVFTIGSVMKLTDLTARQIRYYEEQGLVTPERTEGNRRLYSLNDMDRLLEIKDFIADGKKMSSIREIYANRKQIEHNISDSELRHRLRQEMSQQAGFTSPSATHFGNLRL